MRRKYTKVTKIEDKKSSSKKIRNESEKLNQPSLPVPLEIGNSSYFYTS